MSASWKLVLVTFAQLTFCQNDDIGDIEVLNSNDGKLIFATTVCRHGSRNVHTVYPNDPWADESNWPGGFAQLTIVGQQEHFELGKYFRKRYKSLLGDGSYSAKKIYIGSTDSDRSLMSAEACLSAMFPPEIDRKLNEDINWQPIPVHTVPFKDDHILGAVKQCNRYDFEIQKITNGTMYKQLFRQYKPLLDYLQEKSGFKMSSLTNIILLYDALSTEQSQNKCIPEWAEKVMLPGGEFEYLAKLWYTIQTNNNQLKKIKAGYLLKSIFDRLTNKMQSTLKPNRSVHMYFAHDITLVSILNSLGLYENNRPPLTSCLLFELYQKDEKHYLQLFFRNSTATKLPPLGFRTCGTECTLEKLFEIYKDILPTQPFDDECTLQDWEILMPTRHTEKFGV